MTRAIEAWERFWFAPEPTSTLGVFRIAVGLLVLGWTISLGPDLFDFFSTEGIVPEAPRYGGETTGLWTLLGYFPSDPAVLAMYAALLLASLCLTAGLWTRLAAVVVFVGVMSFQRRDPYVFNGGDQLVRILESAALVPGKTIKVRVQGSFKKKVKLSANLLPGRYAVKITSKSGLKQNGAINLPAPPEGVVAKASASAAETGTPATTLTGDQRELWVRFAFAAFPKAGLPLTISWFLNGQLVAPPVQKSSGPSVSSFIRASTVLPKGTWKAVLQAGDRIVKTVSVQLA